GADPRVGDHRDAGIEHGTECRQRRCGERDHDEPDGNSSAWTSQQRRHAATSPSRGHPAALFYPSLGSRNHGANVRVSSSSPPTHVRWPFGPIARAAPACRGNDEATEEDWIMTPSGRAPPGTSTSIHERQETIMPGRKDPGPSVKDDEQYEAL